MTTRRDFLATSAALAAASVLPAACDGPVPKIRDMPAGTLIYLDVPSKTFTTDGGWSGRVFTVGRGRWQIYVCDGPTEAPARLAGVTLSESWAASSAHRA